jgi:tetratricopeptide (TPR) repeat protein
MKFGSHFIPSLLLGFLLVGCAHQPNPPRRPEISDYSPEQIDRLNREALVVASKRLEEMVIQAKSSQSSINYLATDLFLKGNMSLLEGDYETASVLFKHLVNLVPEDHFVQKKYAITLIRTGDLEGSVAVLEKLYASGKEEKVGLILAGVYSGVDQDERARKVYRQILAANPKNEDACIFLGKSMAMNKEMDKAIKQLRACSQNDKNNGMYDYYIGKIQLDLGQVPKAMESFKVAYGRQPSLGQAVSALGILLEEREQHDGAIKIYEKYLKGQPNDTSILNRIVQTLFLKERFDEVIPYAEKLSDLEPDNLNLKVKLGILYTDAKVSFDVPTDWQDVQDMLGMPLMLTGPEAGDRRPVITVTPTSITDISFKNFSDSKDNQAYKLGREEFVEKYDGKVNSFFPHQTLKWPNASEVHRFGYNYTIGSVTFVENSYYVICDKQLFHIKTLLSQKHLDTYQDKVLKTVESFSCK